MHSLIPLTVLSLQGFIMLVAVCAIIALVAWAVTWFVAWIGCPEPLAKIITIIVWIIAGVAIVIRLLNYVGIA